MDEPASPPISITITDAPTNIPSANIPVTLTLLSSSMPQNHQHTFHGLTNSHGQLNAEWVPRPHSSAMHSGVLHSGSTHSDNPNPLPLDAVFEEANGKMVWACRIEVKEYFEGKGLRPLLPEVEFKISTEGYFGAGGRGVKRGTWDFRVMIGEERFAIERSG
ncbi:hypothetical protein EG328_008489 [Venturia inaequalis]|uniref:Uncharacterized protein n=1 Tax=Venturia inaequalis TaxID=5025 RepID=A0A8H3YRN3_VENIN|nr:hypothetical protein EG328_008489 [Venturia inaequalis]RDI85936.1 hypothetical protein Vi05172_g3965 [Venturia inaequalis]